MTDINELTTNKNKSKDDYEKTILSVLNKKIFSVPTGAGTKKAKLFKEVDPFLVLL